MKFEHTKVCNLDGAVRGLRNPMQSWDRSDSYQSDFTDDGKCGFVREVCNPFPESESLFRSVGFIITVLVRTRQETFSVI